MRFHSFCDLRTQIFCGLKISACPKYMLFLTKITFNSLIQICTHKIKKIVLKDDFKDCLETDLCTSTKSVDLRYRNEPKNFRICDSGMSPRICGLSVPFSYRYRYCILAVPVPVLYFGGTGTVLYRIKLTLAAFPRSSRTCGGSNCGASCSRRR
jgi:hypothetical protein